MKKIHLSFDDVNSSFNDIVNKKKTLFDNKFFKWLKKLHENYNVKVSLYLQNWGEILENIDDESLKELKNNSDWLKLGIHTAANGSDFSEKTYDQGKKEWNHFVNEIIRVGGEETNIDTFPRLHRFAGTKECLEGMKDSERCAAIGFLSSDDDRTSYYLTDSDCKNVKQRDFIYDKETQLFFRRTDFRLDWLAKNFISQYKYDLPQNRNAYREMKRRYKNEVDSVVVVFTHEWQVYSKGRLTRNRRWIEDVCKYAVDEKYKFVFLMDEVKTSVKG